MNVPRPSATAHVLGIQAVSHCITENDENRRYSLFSDSRSLVTGETRYQRPWKTYMNAQKILTNMREPLHLAVFMFSTCPSDCACIRVTRRVSGTHLFLPTTTRFCDLARAHAYKIEKISNDAKRKWIQEWSWPWRRSLCLDILARSGTNG